MNVWVFWDTTYLGLRKLLDVEAVSPQVRLNIFRAIDIPAGQFYTLLIDLNNNVWMFDRSDQPKLLPDIKAKSVSSGFHHFALIDLEDNLWLYGGNNEGQLGFYGLDSYEYLIGKIKVKQVSAGIYNTAFIDFDDYIWITGDNRSGQLGDGSNKNRATFQKIPISVYPNGEIIFLKGKQVASGDHTMVIDLNNNVWAFGANFAGQLGLGIIIIEIYLQLFRDLKLKKFL